MNPSNMIKLPPALLADLYKNDLVFGNSASEDLPASQQTTQADTLVLSSELSAANKTFLDAILSACKLMPSNIAVILVPANEKIEHTDLEEKYQPKIILLFGIEPHHINLPIHFPSFQIQQFNRIQFLCSPSLAQLENDKELKRKLWQSLQQLYA